MKTSHLPLLLFLLFVHFLCSHAQIQCATPCNSPNACQTAACNTNEGICTISPLFPPPTGCCTENAHCSSSQVCIFASCDLDSNTCVYVPICSGNQPPAMFCQTDDQCRVDNLCAQVKCIDNVCRTSPLPSNNPSCCTSTADCPNNPCTEKFCNVEAFRCFYEPIKGCQVSEATYIIPAEPIPNSPSSSSDDTYKPTSGDIAGAIIGFIILGILVVAFMIVIFLMLVQKAFKKLTSKEPKSG